MEAFFFFYQNQDFEDFFFGFRVLHVVEHVANVSLYLLCSNAFHGLFIRQIHETKSQREAVPFGQACSCSTSCTADDLRNKKPGLVTPCFNDRLPHSQSSVTYEFLVFDARRSEKEKTTWQRQTGKCGNKRCFMAPPGLG